MCKYLWDFLLIILLWELVLDLPDVDDRACRTQILAKPKRFILPVDL